MSCIVFRMHQKAFILSTTKWTIVLYFHSCNHCIPLNGLDSWDNWVKSWSPKHQLRSILFFILDEGLQKCWFHFQYSMQDQAFFFSYCWYLNHSGQRPANHHVLSIQYYGSTWAPNNKPTVTSSSFCVHISTMASACTDSYAENDCVVASIHILQKGQFLTEKDNG